MALATYSDLKSAIAEWLNRSDLSSVIPSFIALCEADINRRLRHPRMIARATTTLDAQYTALPTDFLEMKSLRLLDSPGDKLAYVTVDEAGDKLGELAASGRPRYFAIVGNSIQSMPVPEAEYEAELIYYARIPALSEAAPTGWLLTSHPDLYLYGALGHASPYLHDDERVGLWGAAYGQIIESINQQAEAAQVTREAMRARIRSF